MPWVVDENNCVRKKDDNSVVKCFDSKDEAEDHMRALYANVEESAIAEFSMNIIKASYNKTDSSPRKWRAVGSDIDEDLHEEKMSPELFEDFTYRIENRTPVPEAFKSIICEEAWCGGMPYLSIAHYKAGEGAKNVPGEVDAVYIDGDRLKAKGTLHDSSLGRKVFDSLCDDLYRKGSGEDDHLPVRISIGFLDLQHKHMPNEEGQEFTFTRKTKGQVCPLCVKGIGGKIYTKGQLVHLALTRVPVNPRTEMTAEMDMDKIVTKKDDAESIIGDEVDELDTRSLADGTLVIRAEDQEDVGSVPSSDDPFSDCYDSVRDFYNQDCINRKMVSILTEVNKYVNTVKSKSDVVESETKTENTVGEKSDVTEDKMAKKDKVEKSEEVVEEEVPNTEPVEAAPEEVEAVVEEKVEEVAEVKSEADSLDEMYAELKSKLGKGATAQEVQEAFNEFGKEIEKSYTPPAPTVDDIGSMIKSAVEEAVNPLRMELAQIKAVGAPVAKSDIPVPRSLNLGNSLLEKSRPVQHPTRQLSQIEALARKSTGAYVPEE